MTKCLNEDHQIKAVHVQSTSTRLDEKSGEVTGTEDFDFVRKNHALSKDVECDKNLKIIPDCAKSISLAQNDELEVNPNPDSENVSIIII